MPSAPSRTSPAEQADRKRMSTRQLAQTVRYGRLVTFLIFDGDPITGYLGGMDEDSFLVLVPGTKSYEKWVINRSGNPAYKLHDESSYEGEPTRDAMEEIIAPFRGYVVNRIFNGGARESDTRKAS
jgi:hypothetical protein